MAVSVMRAGHSAILVIKIAKLRRTPAARPPFLLLDAHPSRKSADYPAGRLE